MTQTKPTPHPAQAQGTPSTSNLWYLSYHARHIISDNFGDRRAVVKPLPIYENTDYCVCYIVTQGTMTLKINGVVISLHPNDYLVVMPCTTIELLESRCVYFTETILAHALFDLYEEVSYNVPVRRRAFCFHLYHLSTPYVERLRDIYLMVKREMQQPNYKMKDVVIRSFSKLYLVCLQDAMADPGAQTEVDYERSRQHKLFEEFIELLDVYYPQERSVKFYARKMGLTPKYLSMLSRSAVGSSASSVINSYVIFRIKQLLYRGEHSVKQIGEMLNFPTQSFFGRYFKRIVGISPRQYMLQNCRNYTPDPTYG